MSLSCDSGTCNEPSCFTDSSRSGASRTSSRTCGTSCADKSTGTTRAGSGTAPNDVHVPDKASYVSRVPAAVGKPLTYLSTSVAISEPTTAVVAPNTPAIAQDSTVCGIVGKISRKCAPSASKRLTDPPKRKTVPHTSGNPATCAASAIRYFDANVSVQSTTQSGADAAKRSKIQDASTCRIVVSTVNDGHKSKARRAATSAFGSPTSGTPKSG